MLRPLGAAAAAARSAHWLATKRKASNSSLSVTSLRLASRWMIKSMQYVMIQLRKQSMPYRGEKRPTGAVPQDVGIRWWSKGALLPLQSLLHWLHTISRILDSRLNLLLIKVPILVTFLPCWHRHLSDLWNTAAHCIILGIPTNLCGTEHTLFKTWLLIKNMQNTMKVLPDLDPVRPFSVCPNKTLVYLLLSRISWGVANHLQLTFRHIHSSIESKSSLFWAVICNRSSRKCFQRCT